MIRINLLPAELESAPTQISPAIPLAVAVAIPVALSTVFHFVQVGNQKKLQTEKESLTKELDRYQPVIREVERLEAMKVQLQNRKTVIQQLESERLRYPQFMDDFLKMLPGNLWLSNLNTVIDGAQLKVNIDVTALDNYAIADLIANLEGSQIFTDVDLGAISTAQSQTGQTMTFHLSTNYRKMNTLPDAGKKP
jgi:Tfp pilus assembly protein PilN